MSDLRDDDPLDPGIARTVLWLREHGFNTSDSGDGKAKFEPSSRYYEDVPVQDSPCAEHYCCAILDFPHVAIKVDHHELVDRADRLFFLLRGMGIECGALVGAGVVMNSPLIECGYNPADGVAYIFLSGVDDALLFKEN